MNGASGYPINEYYIGSTYIGEYQEGLLVINEYSLSHLVRSGLAPYLYVVDKDTIIVRAVNYYYSLKISVSNSIEFNEVQVYYATTNFAGRTYRVFSNKLILIP